MMDDPGLALPLCHRNQLRLALAILVKRGLMNRTSLSTASDSQIAGISVV